MSRWTDDATMLTKRAPNAKPITWGAFRTQAPVGDEDRITTDAAGQERLTRFTIATVASSAFPGLTRESTVYVESVSHVVRDIRPIDDGLLSELFLTRTVT